MFRLGSNSVNNVRLALFLSTALLLSACGSPEDRAQTHYKKGMELLAQNNTVLARVEFRNALQRKKDMVEAWRGLAAIEERNGNIQGLVPLLRTIIELDAKDVASRIRLGTFLLLSNMLDDALALANAAGEIEERNAGVHALKAGIMLRLGDSLAAVREARAALEIEPTNPDATVVLAAERLANKDPQGALQILDKLSEQHISNIGFQLFRVKVLEQLGDLKESEAALRKLVDLFPNEQLYRRLLLHYLVSQKRNDDAEQELRRFAALDPKNTDAALDVVRFINATKGPEAARQELLNRIAAGGDVFNFQIALAGLHFAQRQFDDAARIVEPLTKSGPSENILAAQLALTEMYIAQKKLDAAEPLIAEVLRKDGRNTNGLRLRAVVRLERGQFEGAITDLRQALNDQPRSTPLMLLLANAYERSGSMELAEKQYADATRASNFDAGVGLAHVAFLRRRGNIAAAEDILTELASRSPRNIQVLSTLAEVRLLRQNWIGAQEVAEAIRKIGNDRGLADQIVGEALAGRGRSAESIGILQSAYENTPGAIQPMFALVRAYLRAQQADRAVTFLQGVLKASPDNAQAHVLLATVYFALDELDKASNSLGTAIKIDPTNTNAYRVLADIHRRRGNLDEAIRIVQAGLALQPNSFGLRLTAASLFEIKGEHEQAISQYEEMLKLDPGSLIAINNLVSLLTDFRTDKESLDRAYSLAPALRKSPLPQFKDTLGWTYYRRGEYRPALALLEEAVAELPSNPLVRYHLGMTYMALEQNPKAIEQFEKALALKTVNEGLEAKIRAAMKKIGSS